MKKKTAVEWLINEHFGGIENCTPDFRYHIEQAKKMEKANIIDTWYDCKMSIIDKNPTTADEYYNKTFKQQEK